MMMVIVVMVIIIVLDMMAIKIDDEDNPVSHLLFVEFLLWVWP